MKKRLTTRNFLLLIIMALGVVLVHYMEINASQSAIIKSKNTQLKEFKEKELKWMERDSLHFDHITKCLYFDRRDVYVDKWGHIRIKASSRPADWGYE